MTNEELQKRILQIEPDAVCAENKQFLIVEIPLKNVYSIAKTLRESSDLLFDFAFSITGIDDNQKLGVIYHLQSSKYSHCIVLKVFAESRENPQIPSVSEIWKAAELQEREIFDFYGISFVNHPDLRRIFLDDEWVGYPLRKDYVDTVNIIDLIK